VGVAGIRPAVTIIGGSGMANARIEYLKSLAEAYGVSLVTVFTLADMLGENEDYDGLVSALSDFPVGGDELC